MRLALLLLVAAGAHASASPALVRGSVAATRSSWSDDVIVTTSEVRGADGASTTVVQLGGVVDGVGMSFSHQPALLHAGDEVTLTVSAGVTSSGATTRALIDVQPNASAVPQLGSARYGVQRTTRSLRPLWRDSGCLEIHYDATSIPADAARVLDAAFETWTHATAGCGGLAVSSYSQPNVRSARDGASTIVIRRDRWCRPASGAVPELCYAPEASAVTRLVFVDDPADPEDGKILEADMELNAVDFVLFVPGQPAPTTTKPVLELLAVATHEVGHVLGLAHDCGTGHEPWPSDHAGNPVPSCEAATADVRAATMYYALDPLDLSAATLEASDVAGVCTLSRGLTCEEVVEGGCAAGGASSSPWAALLGLTALAWWRRYRRRNRPRGARTGQLA